MHFAHKITINWPVVEIALLVAVASALRIAWLLKPKQP